MEILPHFWVGYFKNNENTFIIKNKNIKCIILLSKYEPFFKKSDVEELRIPIDYEEGDSFEEKNNIMYQHLFDITDYIHERLIKNNNVFLLGYENKQDIDIIIIAYFIRFGKISVGDSIAFLKSKKKYIFEPKCLFFFALNKFYNEINKI
jgi:hypothetical protein